MVQKPFSVEATEVLQGLFNEWPESFRGFVMGGVYPLIEHPLKLHKSYGLWEWEPDGDGKSWSNVTEHCVIVAIRAMILGTKLGLFDELVVPLMHAAILHDSYKAHEKAIVVANGLEWNAFEKAAINFEVVLKNEGFDDLTIRLATASGHGSLLQAQDLIEKNERSPLTPEEIAWCIHHYVDDYTIGSKPASKADPAGFNDLDSRIRENIKNPRYVQLNEEGKQYFGGLSTFEMQLEVGLKIQKILFDLLKDEPQRGLAPNRPFDLPYWVDQKIEDLY